MGQDSWVFSLQAGGRYSYVSRCAWEQLHSCAEAGDRLLLPGRVFVEVSGQQQDLLEVAIWKVAPDSAQLLCLHRCNLPAGRESILHQLLARAANRALQGNALDNCIGDYLAELFNSTSLRNTAIHRVA